MKKLSTPAIVVFVILGLAIYSYATQMAEQRTVQAFLAQRTSFVEGRCMYFDGFQECPISSEYCLSEGEIYSVNLGMCDNLQSRAAPTVTPPGVQSLKVTTFVSPVDEGNRGRFVGEVVVKGAGKYLIEVGPDVNQWQAATGRTGIQKLPIALQSICDNNINFASNIISVEEGTTIRFDLKPVMVEKPGDWTYYVIVTNGCYKDLGDQTTVYAKSVAIPIKVTTLGTVGPGTTVTYGNVSTGTVVGTVSGATTSSGVLDDIKSDFSWVNDMFKGIQTKYLIYGGLALGAILLLFLLVSPNQSRAPQRGY